MLHGHDLKQIRHEQQSDDDRKLLAHCRDNVTTNTDANDQGSLLQI